jgi:hypothetical protein
MQHAASSLRSTPLTTTGSPLHSAKRARSSNVTDTSKSSTRPMRSAFSASSGEARFGNRNQSGGVSDACRARRPVGTAAPSTDATIAR